MDWPCERCWRVVGPSGAPAVDPEHHPKRFWGQGGEIEVWESRDHGAHWVRRRQLTAGSPRNPGHVRRGWNARDPFAHFWADGGPEELTESHLYFGNLESTRYWELPYEMDADAAPPLEQRVPGRP